MHQKYGCTQSDTVFQNITRNVLGAGTVRQYIFSEDGSFREYCDAHELLLRIVCISKKIIPCAFCFYAHEDI